MIKIKSIKLLSQKNKQTPNEKRIPTYIRQSNLSTNHMHYSHSLIFVLGPEKPTFVLSNWLVIQFFRPRTNNTHSTIVPAQLPAYGTYSAFCMHDSIDMLMVKLGTGNMQLCNINSFIKLPRSKHLEYNHFAALSRVCTRTASDLRSKQLK